MDIVRHLRKSCFSVFSLHYPTNAWTSRSSNVRRWSQFPTLFTNVLPLDLCHFNHWFLLLKKKKKKNTRQSSSQLLSSVPPQRTLFSKSLWSFRLAILTQNQDKTLPAKHFYIWRGAWLDLNCLVVPCTTKYIQLCFSKASTACNWPVINPVKIIHFSHCFNSPFM